jgi:Icc-related predicted phosphoesterase
MIRIVCISDTHSKHNSVKIPQGDILIHAGDLTSVGYEHEVKNFVHWFQNINGFEDKIFIAGNHDLSFETKPDWFYNYINEENLTQSDCVYLEDSELIITDPDFSGKLKIYGSPWQPEFMNWGFNLPRNGEELKQKWNKIPEDTDILITHGPPQTILDTAGWPHNSTLLGCELLLERVNLIKPKIHVFGHIHGSNGYYFNGHTHFINACQLNEQYKNTNKPIVFDWDYVKNEIHFTK